MAFLSVVGLTACSDDEPKDSVKEIRMQVSAETGVMYAWGDDKKENPIECMLANPPADGWMVPTVRIRLSVFSKTDL